MEELDATITVLVVQLFTSTTADASMQPSPQEWCKHSACCVADYAELITELPVDACNFIIIVSSLIRFLLRLLMFCSITVSLYVATVEEKR